jgi:hypothetical protein
MDHEFKTGQLVRLREKLLENNGIYEILRPLPGGSDGEPLYRIKAASGPIERVVREVELLPATGVSAGAR